VVKESGEKIGVGVIGVGFMGNKHAEVFAGLEGCNLIGIAETNKELLVKKSQEFECLAFTDYEELIQRKDVAAVTICLPEDEHVTASISAIEAGKHLFLEKPLATSLKDCDKILDCAARHKVKLMIGHLLRFDPKYAQAYEIVKSGEIGEILQIKAQRDGMISAGYRSGKYTSVIFHVGIHDIDLMLWFVNSSPIKVYAEQVKSVLADVGTEDAILSIVKFKNGVVGSVGCSWVLNDRMGSGVNASMEVIGTDGYISINVGAERGLRIFSNKEGWQYPDIWHWPVIWQKIGGCLAAELSHFLECIRKDKDPIISGKDARAAVAVALAALNSIKTGQPVVLSII
jgi:predicted dehydrogenase